MKLREWLLAKNHNLKSLSVHYANLCRTEYWKKIQIDPGRLQHGLVCAAALFNALICRVFNEHTTVEEAMDTIVGLLQDERNVKDPAEALQRAIRDAWIGRVCTDGSFDGSKDFEFEVQLTTGQPMHDHFKVESRPSQLVSDLLLYVVRPILILFHGDLSAYRYEGLCA